MQRTALVCTLLVALCLAGAAQAQDAATCRSLFNQVGGLQGLTAFMPNCVPEAYNAAQCCQQAKSALGLAPAAGTCLCNAEVWGEVQSQARAAGFGDQLGGFLGSCDIKVAGKGC